MTREASAASKWQRQHLLPDVPALEPRPPPALCHPCGWARLGGEPWSLMDVEWTPSVRPSDPPFPGTEGGERRWVLGWGRGGGLWLVLLTVPASGKVWKLTVTQHPLCARHSARTFTLLLPTLVN